MRELPKYKKSTGEEGAGNEGEDEEGEKKPLSDELSEKTNQLLDYIEKTYLQGVIESDPQGKNIIDKMRLDNTQKVRNKKKSLRVTKPDEIASFSQFSVVSHMFWMPRTLFVGPVGPF